MPVSKNTLCAFSRSRMPATFSSSKNLVPFLYQTATIQQWNPMGFPVGRRNAGSHHRQNIDLPLDNVVDNQLSVVEDERSPRRTTITGSERAAFEKLYKKFQTTDEHKSSSEIPFSHEIDQIADEWYEEDEENTPDSDSASLDAVFDSVLAGLPANQTHKTLSRKPTENLKTIAERILKPEHDAARRKAAQETQAETTKRKGMQDAEKARVRGLFDHAKTDREVWDILEREVFSMIRSLDLDSEQQPTKKPTSSLRGKHATASTNTTNSDRSGSAEGQLQSQTRILLPNYPSHLVYATRLLNKRFPSSPLAFSILPTMKSLGRSSYALGASTQLYNLLIMNTWLQHSSFTYIEHLLKDMNNSGVEPDNFTLRILEDVLRESDDARKGKLGEAMRQLWKMETFAEGAKRIAAWKDWVAQRLGAWSTARAEQGTQSNGYNQSAVDLSSPETDQSDRILSPS